MVLTNIFGTMAKWSKRPIGGGRNDLDTYKEKLCDLVDHHFERKQFTRHVSTRVPRREKKWTRMQTRHQVLDMLWRNFLHTVVRRTDLSYLLHYISNQASSVYSEHHLTLFRTNYWPSTLLQDSFFFSSRNPCWNMSSKLFPLKVMVYQVTELLFICV